VLAELNGLYDPGCAHVRRRRASLRAYVELCRLSASCRSFIASAPTGNLPYDHDDLAKIFRDVDEKIDTSGNMWNGQVEWRDFIGEGDSGMRVTSSRNGWRQLAMVHRRPSGETLRATVHCLLAPGALNWKLAVLDRFDAFFRRAKEGLQLTPSSSGPGGLAATVVCSSKWCAE